MASAREDLHACPSDETVALFLAGGLAPKDDAAFRQHLDGCDLCRGLIAEAGREGSALPVTRISAPRMPAAGAPVPAALAVGDFIGGKYRIDAKLGQGGMGDVFRGWHLGLSRAVAIKVMHTEIFSAHLARRFFREARAAASLTSQHAVRILDIDHLASGIPYIVMENLEGRDLHEVIVAEGPLPWRRVVDIVLQATEALREAHAHGIIHRDLKPHNLFLTRDGVVKVLDFGLAKLMPSSLVQGSSGETKATGLVGSPQYMAPEQIRAARTVDARTDIYGLGATMYQLLTGAAPFLGLNLYVLCARILNEPVQPIGKTRPDVPSAMEAVVMRCLEKSPASRFASTDELAAALRAALEAPGSTRRPEGMRMPPARSIDVPTVTGTPATKQSAQPPGLGGPTTTQREQDLHTQERFIDRTEESPLEKTLDHIDRTVRLDPPPDAPPTEAKPTPQTDPQADGPPMTERMPRPDE